MRMFFAPLARPSEAADSRCWFAWPFRRGNAFPRPMKLEPSPAAAGIYNHWEFLKIVLTLCSSWDVAICSYKQTSICNFLITGVAERVEAAAHVAQTAAGQSAPAASSSKEPEIDPSFFDAPCMKQHETPFFGGQGFGMDGAGFAEADDAGYMFEEEDEEFIDAGVASDDDLQQLLQQTETAEELVKPVEKVADTDAKSESGASRASAAGIKTPATDFEILKECLGERQLPWFNHVSAYVLS